VVYDFTFAISSVVERLLHADGLVCFPGSAQVSL
jgi:hypothetical protein